MKNTLAMTALVVALSSNASAADNFDNNTYKLSVGSGALDFALDGNKNGITDFEVGATGLEHTLGEVDAVARAAFGYNFNTDTISVRGEYDALYDVTASATVYGTVAVEYATIETDLADGDFLFDPSLGVEYVFDNTFAVFGEIGYTWNMSDDWRREGAYVEVGMPITVNKSITVTPGFVRGIDGSADETNFNLDVGVVF